MLGVGIKMFLNFNLHIQKTFEVYHMRDIKRETNPLFQKL